MRPESEERKAGGAGEAQSELSEATQVSELVRRKEDTREGRKRGVEGRRARASGALAPRGPWQRDRTRGDGSDKKTKTRTSEKGESTRPELLQDRKRVEEKGEQEMARWRGDTGQGGMGCVKGEHAVM